jgi:hypothetical protein
VPVEVDRAGAAEWLDGVLAEPAEGAATVVFHSIVWQYLDPGEQTRAERAIRRAAESATPGAPVAWLRMEAAGEAARVELTTWPGGEDRLVCHSGYHGRPVRWVA